jgi:hypothetical protein
MSRMTRAAAIRMLAGGVAAAVGGLFTTGRGTATRPVLRDGGMMGTGLDMSAYIELFDRHSEIRRTVTEIPGGVRTLTESAAPDLVAQLQAHVASVYGHLDHGVEVTCMSSSLPTLFRNASAYRRELRLTNNGVAVTETARDPRIVAAIRAHAREVSGFVREGMAAMMAGSGMMSSR